MIELEPHHPGIPQSITLASPATAVTCESQAVCLAVQGLSVADSSYVTSSDVVRFAIRAATRPVSDGERASANNNQPNQASQASAPVSLRGARGGNRQQRGS